MFVLKVTDLLDYGVHVMLAWQRPGDMVVGGPGLCHGVGREHWQVEDTWTAESFTLSLPSLLSPRWCNMAVP